MGLERIGGKSLLDRPTMVTVPGALAVGRAHTSVVRVRNGSVSAYLDDQLVCDYPTDYANMSPPPTHVVGKHVLGLGAGNVVFHAADLTEVSGRGRLRPDHWRPAPPDRRVVTNGSMTEGGDAPAGWALGPTDQRTGEGRLVRDTADFHSPPASLRLDGGGGDQPAHAFAGHAWTSLPSDPVKIEGYAKAQGTFTEAWVVVQAFDRDARQIVFKPLIDLKRGPGWTKFRDVILTPEGTQYAVLNVILRGRGSVWLDDVEVFVPNEP